jgi:hypothetical protein
MNDGKGKRPAARKSVGPGLHLGKVELASDGAYVVRLMNGERVTARLDTGIAPDFVDQCTRSGKRLVVADGERGAVIVGALERPSSSPSAKTVHSETLHLRVDKELVIEVGKYGIRLDGSGAAHVKTRQIVIDAASLARFLSARVELP